MKYVGLDTQIRRNNRRSILLLLSFPLLILAGVYGFFLWIHQGNFYAAGYDFMVTIPFVLGGVAIWFLIAFSSHSTMIRLATGSETLDRKNNMRVYNLTENLCMSVGMKMPKLRIIESDQLNAFASGINENTYTVTLTRGIIEKLNDQELEGVIAHELMHIRNRDVRLLIVSIIFVGIFSFVVSILFRSLLFGGARRRNNKDGGGQLIIIALVIAVVVYFLSILFRFALSRKREYMADAGAADMTRNPMALASALRKISGNSNVDVNSDEVKQMFIDNGPAENEAGFSGLSGLFATHPPIMKRVQFLENM
ncbi:MAG: M48 family metallopeptidase [bacterium]|nr:M48 family metallopeptidase [bacterium]